MNTKLKSRILEVRIFKSLNMSYYVRYGFFTVTVTDIVRHISFKLNRGEIE